MNAEDFITNEQSERIYFLNKNDKDKQIQEQIKLAYAEWQTAQWTFCTRSTKASSFMYARSADAFRQENQSMTSLEKRSNHYGNSNNEWKRLYI